MNLLNLIQPSLQSDQKRALMKMRRTALLLLLSMSLIYFLLIFSRIDFFWVPYAKAFSEAAMVGALADWFAVVAIFRHPLGIPIPHTAIIPSNQKRIAKALGQFVSDNFLTRQAINRKFSKIDATSTIASWLYDEVNANKIADIVISSLPEIIKFLPEDRLRKLLDESARRGAETLQLASLSAHLLEILWVNGEAQIVLDRAIIYLGDTLSQKRGYIKNRVSKNAPSWLPKWIDALLIERVVNGLSSTFKSMRDPSHPWRREINTAVEKLIHELEVDPEFQKRGEKIKQNLLSDPVFMHQIDLLWQKVEAALISDFSTRKDEIQQGIKKSILDLAQLIQSDERMKQQINRRIRLLTIIALAPRRNEIGAYITEVVSSWETKTLVEKIEMNVGKDLQYIRINGTLIGGLVGVIIYMLTHWLENMR